MRIVIKDIDLQDKHHHMLLIIQSIDLPLERETAVLVLVLIKIIARQWEMSLDTAVGGNGPCPRLRVQ